jgi:two-component system cell cycle sensor histidine kinase/response regulator CckA
MAPIRRFSGPSPWPAALDLLGDGVIAVDGDGAVVWMNAAAEDLTGWRRDGARGQPIDRVVMLAGEQGPEGSTAPIRLALSTGRCPEAWSDVTLQRPDGTMAAAGLAVATDGAASGRDAAPALVLRDRRHAHQLHAALAELEQARRLEAVGRLAAGVAHDFSNVLTIITGDAEMLLDGGSVDPQSRELLQEIAKAGARGAALTRQLLAFSRRSDALPLPVDVNAFVERTRAVLRPLLSDDVQLELDLAAPGAQVVIDANQFELLLLNLAAHARDAMPRGGRLTIATRLADASMVPERPRSAGGMVEIAVTHIARGAVEAAPPGEPVGVLAGVFRIVEQAQGVVQARSEGAAVTWAAYLPLADTPAGGASEPDVEATHGPRPAILLVEDDDGVRHLMVEALRARGYQVLQAATSADALRLAGGRQDAQVQLLITDVVLPDADGTALALALRAQLPGLQVIFTSGGSDEVLRRHGLDPEQVVRKPFTPRSFVAAVRRVLEAAQRRDA